MAKKQVIRLTEGDLHRIIKESVDNILSELDWKTYANAAKKRYQQSKEKPQDRKLFDKAYKLGKKAKKNLRGNVRGSTLIETAHPGQTPW